MARGSAASPLKRKALTDSTGEAGAEVTDTRCRQPLPNGPTDGDGPAGLVSPTKKRAVTRTSKRRGPAAAADDHPDRTEGGASDSAEPAAQEGHAQPRKRATRSSAAVTKSKTTGAAVRSGGTAKHAKHESAPVKTAAGAAGPAGVETTRAAKRSTRSAGTAETKPPTRASGMLLRKR